MSLDEPVDWAEFERGARRHDVEPLVHRSGWADRHGAPQSVRDRLRETTRRQVLATLRHHAFMQESISALEREGIPVLVLKGAAVATYAYADPGVRSPGDLDLLVPANQVARSVRVLRELGFGWRGWGAWWHPPEDAAAREASLENVDRLPMLKHVDLAGAGKTLELHWQLAGNRHLLPLEERWIDEPQRLSTAGGAIPTLPLVPTWWHVAVHGATHLWARLKWLVDMMALALRHPQLASLDALEETEAIGIQRCVAGGLLVAEKLFGEFLLDDARHWAGSVHGTRPITSGTLLALERPEMDAGSVPPRALPRYALERLALRPDVRYRAEELRRILLEGAREWNVPDPGVAVLLRGPRRWIGRHRERRAAADGARD